MTQSTDQSPSLLIKAALDYHAYPRPGKFTTVPSKVLRERSDLALAYSPGVAYACQAIHHDPSTAYRYTMKRNLVAVISNGTAVLGLGDIGPLASKPVMEGKAVLFQHFAGLDAIDVEIQENDPQALIETIARLAPTFGAINLEDIKSPECFDIESALMERLDIPVFHDDQHGTAVTVCAAILNALMVVGKTIDRARFVIAGAGAGALACARLLEEMGASRPHMAVVDSKGLIHAQRCDLSPHKQAYAHVTDHRTLEHALQGADIFLGLSVGQSVTPAMIQSMAPKPIVFALANPEPEIWPSEVHAVRPDALVGTGRSDLPNQINNVLCFPYIFRGAMDAMAPTITLNMKKACVKALQELAQQGCQESLLTQGKVVEFGPSYVIPQPFDRRLGVQLPLAVAMAACHDFPHLTLDPQVYSQQLLHRAYGKRSLFFMQRLKHVSGVKTVNLPPVVTFRLSPQLSSLPSGVTAAMTVLSQWKVATPVWVTSAKSRSQKSREVYQSHGSCQWSEPHHGDVVIDVMPQPSSPQGNPSDDHSISLWSANDQWWIWGSRPVWLETLLTSWRYDQTHPSDGQSPMSSMVGPVCQWRGCAFPLTDEPPTIGPLGVNQAMCTACDSVEHILEVVCLALWRKEACSDL